MELIKKEAIRAIQDGNTNRVKDLFKSIDNLDVAIASAMEFSVSEGNLELLSWLANRYFNVFQSNGNNLFDAACGAGKINIANWLETRGYGLSEWFSD